MTTETAVRTWNIDAAHSIAEFAVRHMMVSTVKGRFGTLEGAIEGNEANPVASAVRATIDVASRMRKMGKPRMSRITGNPK